MTLVYHRDMEGRIAAIVLASGWSASGAPPESAGPPDALRPVDGGVALAVVLRTLRAVPVDAIVVVLGRDSGVVRERVHLEGVTVVERSRPEPMIASLRAALAAVPDAAGAIVWPADRALVAIRTVRMLVAAHASGALLAVPVCAVPGDDEGRRGHPVIFDRSLFVELEAAPDADGAAAVVHAHEDDLTPVDVEDRGILADVGSPEVQTLLARMRAAAKGLTGAEDDDRRPAAPRRPPSRGGKPRPGPSRRGPGR